MIENKKYFNYQFRKASGIMHGLITSCNLALPSNNGANSLKHVHILRPKMKMLVKFSYEMMLSSMVLVTRSPSRRVCSIQGGKWGL